MRKKSGNLSYAPRIYIYIYIYIYICNLYFLENIRIAASERDKNREEVLGLLWLIPYHFNPRYDSKFRVFLFLLIFCLPEVLSSSCFVLFLFIYLIFLFIYFFFFWWDEYLLSFIFFICVFLSSFFLFFSFFFTDAFITMN